MASGLFVKMDSNHSYEYENNTWRHECVDTYGCAIASCLVTLMSILAIVGNSLNILVLATGKFLAKPHVYFLISLAVADLLTGVVNSFSIYPSIQHTWPYGQTFCFITNYVRESLLEISLFTILCLNLERYIAISYPLRSKIWVTGKRGKIFIFLGWTVTFLLKIYLLFDVVYIVEYDDEIFSCSPEYDNYKSIAFISCTMMEVPGLIILTATSIKLTVKLKKMNNRRRMLVDHTSLRRRQSSNSRNLRRNLHGFKVLAVVAAVSYISLLPSLTLNLTYIIRDEEASHVGIFWAMEFSLFWLASCGSCANVFVYFFMDRKFSKCLKDMLKKLKNGFNRESVVSSRSSSFSGSGLSQSTTLSVLSKSSLNLQDNRSGLDVGL